jgi:hypothetical protein
MPTNKEKDHLAKEPSIGFKRMSVDLEALIEDTRCRLLPLARDTPNRSSETRPI